MMVRATLFINGAAVSADIEMHDVPDVPYRVEFDELSRKVRNLDNRVTNHMGTSMRMDLSNIGDLIYAIQSGQKIAAIKALRTATPGLGLKEAKDLVESGWNSNLSKAVNKLPVGDYFTDDDGPQF